MAATIDMAGERATITNGVWSCDNETLLSLLDSMLEPMGPSGADPNPDLHTAQAAIKQIGGKVIRFDETAYVKGRIY